MKVEKVPKWRGKTSRHWTQTEKDYRPSLHNEVEDYKKGNFKRALMFSAIVIAILLFALVYFSNY